jgi:hypothetical protein
VAPIVRETGREGNFPQENIDFFILCHDKNNLLLSSFSGIISWGGKPPVYGFNLSGNQVG